MNPVLNSRNRSSENLNNFPKDPQWLSKQWRWDLVQAIQCILHLSCTVSICRVLRAGLTIRSQNMSTLEHWLHIKAELQALLKCTLQFAPKKPKWLTSSHFYPLFVKPISCILSKTLAITQCHRRNYMAEGDRVEDILTCETQKVATPCAAAMPLHLVWPRGGYVRRVLICFWPE